MNGDFLSAVLSDSCVSKLAGKSESDLHVLR
jgi:hypothetical protein